MTSEYVSSHVSLAGVNVGRTMEQQGDHETAIVKVEFDRLQASRALHRPANQTPPAPWPDEDPEMAQFIKDFDGQSLRAKGKANTLKLTGREVI